MSLTIPCDHQTKLTGLDHLIMYPLLSMKIKFDVIIKPNQHKLNILLSPYLCLITFLYLVLYVLGDDAWIS